MTVFLDRSNVNGPDDYKKAGVTHLYLKVSEGTTFVDATYHDRRNQGIAAGAKTGGYHFAGHNDPASEAAFFLSKLVAPKPGELRPCLDLESGQSASWAEAFVRHVHDALGYWPVLYGSTSIIEPMRQSSQTLRHCPWWRAEFGPNDGGRHALSGGELGAVAHQYTSVATLAGISGHTDRSEFIDAKAMLVPAVDFKKWGVYHDGDHKRNFRRYARALLWATRHRPREGHQIAIRHRKEGS
jgi:lysozyme